MATLNVQDYGAVGDGSTDDTQAIQDAIDATSNGDTVLIPQTNDFYRLDYSSGGSGVAITLTNAADNVTITGESADSKLVVDRNIDTGSPVCMGVDDMSGAAWTSITIKKLVFDGGKEKFNNSESNGFAWAVTQTRTGYDVLMEDCIFQNAAGAGSLMAYSDGISRITYRNCTARNNDGHGFDPIGTGEGSPSNPECQFIDCKASNNGGIGIDFHSGNHLCDGFYGTGNTNGMKAGEAGGPVNHITLKNFHHRNSNNKGFYQSFSETGWSLDVEDCYFEGHPVDGLELRKSCNCTVTGTLMVDDSADGGDTSNNIEVLESSDFDASNGTVISQNASSGVGITAYQAGNVTIDTYYHYNNSEGAIGGDTTIDITNQINQEQSMINVPSESDVGAFSNDYDINVQDYGAVGDGSTDDSQAIQDAINATSNGDTVFIPETTDHYRIYDGTTGTDVAIYLENAADNVTITGESRDSKLVLDSPDGKSACMGVEDMSGAAWTSITIKQLVFDAGRDDYDDGDGNAFAWRVNTTRTGYDILMEDCVFQNASNRDMAGGAGCPMANDDGISRITFRNCTSNNNDGHGFDPVGTGEGSPSDPECKFIDCEVSNNQQAIDFHSGNHLLDGFYGTGNEQGMKAGSAGGPVNHITLKRVNHRNSTNGNGFYQTFDNTGWTLDVEDALFVGHPKEGLELRKSCNCTVTGKLMVDGCSSDGVAVLEGSDLDANSATVISQNNGAHGVYTAFSDHGGDTTIDTFYHFGNTEEPIDGGSTYNVSTQIEEEQTEINVPTESEVGAFASTSDVGGGSGGGGEDVVWETAGDWDVAQSETNAHHEQPTGTNWATSDTVEKGYPSTDPGGSALEAYYPFDTVGSGTLTDVAGSNDSLTVNSVTTEVGPFGRNAGLFDGTGSYIELPTGILSTGSDWTISFWVNPDDSNSMRVVHPREDINTIIALNNAGTTTGTPKYIDVWIDEWDSDLATVPVNTWSHVAVTYDDSTTTLNVFVDGTQQTNDVNVISTSSTSNGNWLGADTDQTDIYDGGLAEVKFYSRILSSAEISDEANAPL